MARLRIAVRLPRLRSPRRSYTLLTHSLTHSLTSPLSQVSLAELMKLLPITVCNGPKVLEVLPKGVMAPNLFPAALRAHRGRKRFGGNAVPYYESDQGIALADVDPTRLAERDTAAAAAAAEAAEAGTGPLLSAVNEGREARPATDVDYVLVVATGEEITDEDIFEVMIPPTYVAPALLDGPPLLLLLLDGPPPPLLLLRSLLLLPPGTSTTRTTTCCWPRPPRPRTRRPRPRPRRPSTRPASGRRPRRR